MSQLVGDLLARLGVVGYTRLASALLTGLLLYLGWSSRCRASISELLAKSSDRLSKLPHIQLSPLEQQVARSSFI